MYADLARFNNYNPTTFGWPHAVPDLVPFTFGGTNFGQCARAALPVFTALLTELVPHIPGGINFGPHDDWAYSTTDDLPDGSWSFHRYGIAFDLNWNDNPMGTYSTNPDAGKPGAIPHDAASAIATKYGCEYGGDWSGGDGHRGFKDYMHFEVHLPPSVARTVQPPAPAVKPAEPNWSDDMPLIVRVSKTDAARLKVRWPGIFLLHGNLTHIATPADYTAYKAIKLPEVEVTIAEYHSLGGK